MRRHERYALVADESGNASEAVRVLAGLSGSSQRLLKLERLLRAVLKRNHIREIKWSMVRTRPSRLHVAREFLALALEEAASSSLRMDLLIFEMERSSRSWERLDERERWMSLYRILIQKARRWRPGASWTLYPDQRTGMPWKRLGGRVVESSSRKLALVQLADLLAGMARFSRQDHTRSAARARNNRQEILGDFLGMADTMGLLKKRSLVFWPIRNLGKGKRRIKGASSRV